MTTFSLAAVFHHGNPKWHTEMVASVVLCLNATEEILDIYIQNNALSTSKNASFFKKVDLCAKQVGTAFPKDACHTLRELRNLCAHVRSRSDEPRQLKILDLLHTLEKQLGLVTPKLGLSMHKKSFSHIAIKLCDSVMQSLSTSAPPLVLGSVAGPSKTVIELQEYFINPSSSA